MDNLKKRQDESFEEYCHRISGMRKALDITWDAIAQIINSNTDNNFTGDKYRKQEKKYSQNNIENGNKQIKYHFLNKLNATNVKDTVTVNYEKGETTSIKNIPIEEKDLSDPDALLKAHGFNSNNWSIKSCTNSATDRFTSNGKTQIYTSRIVVKPKDGNELTLQAIDKYFDRFDEKDFDNINIDMSSWYNACNDEFLEICVQDLHMGLLSYGQETGEDYDIGIAKKRLENCINDIYQRCNGRKFKRIVFVLLGDILHVDNLDGTTTKGTRQDIDTRPTKIFDEALDLLIETIEKLNEIAPVDVINLQGNHDKLSSYMLCRALEKAFRNNTTINFYNNPNPRKWVVYGKVLIGYSHGDMKPSAVSEWLSNECSAWSEAKYREVHLGHLHSLSTLQKIEDNCYGLIVRYLPALCASSAWEHEQGFPKSQRGVMSFVWNEKKGLREIWCTNI